MSDAVIYRRTVTVINDQGLHFRPCQLIALAAQDHNGSIVVTRGSVRADAKSIMELLTLAAERGTSLEIEATGENAEVVVDKVSDLFSNGFHTPTAS